ncbi:pentatricopeptide repeat-containing protein At5g46100-like [Magnolia sinica]|uniref:pentatricopeptide repeat-containing protein At5g46100-like n=1 Tax=Magnolia sinica TaxID=86752 RepID=UPI002659FCD5|nr:pentatricopeptide repeat-containing protein At5g46100-like [Magnolia sinica]
MMINGHSADNSLLGDLVSAHALAGDVDRAFKVFSEIGSFDCCADIVTYNTLVNGLCQSSHQADAVKSGTLVDFFDELANWLTRLDWPNFGFMAYTLVPPGEQPGSHALIGTMI